jgi:hypothetical protein
MIDDDHPPVLPDFNRICVILGKHQDCRPDWEWNERHDRARSQSTIHRRVERGTIRCSLATFTRVKVQRWDRERVPDAELPYGIFTVQYPKLPG